MTFALAISSRCEGGGGLYAVTQLFRKSIKYCTCSDQKANYWHFISADKSVAWKFAFACLKESIHITYYSRYQVALMWPLCNEQGERNVTKHTLGIGFLDKHSSCKHCTMYMLLEKPYGTLEVSTVKLWAEVRIQAVNNDGGHCQICCHTYSSSGGMDDFVDLLFLKI